LAVVRLPRRALGEPRGRSFASHRELKGQLIRRDERGQGLAEYALFLALIAVVVIAAVTLLGTNINSILSTIATSI
jgi:pilus assembly protein Flp/PilA